jgi:hypothetical protein
MADKRGLVASYPFAVQAPDTYEPRNEERFRAQMAQANAEIYDRLANIETDVDAVEKGLGSIPSPASFATGPEALDGTSADTIISPATLKLVLDTLTNLLVPTGSVMYFAGDAPAGWLTCDGDVVTPAFPDLRAYLIAAGSPYGAVGADPRMPNLLGEFIRGADLGRGVDVGRVFGSFQGDAIRNITGSIRTLHSFRPFSPSGLTGAFAPSADRGPSLGGSGAASFTDGGDFSAARVVPTAADNRPRNIALRPCIKT